VQGGLPPAPPPSPQPSPSGRGSGNASPSGRLDGSERAVKARRRVRARASSPFFDSGPSVELVRSSHTFLCPGIGINPRALPEPDLNPPAVVAYRSFSTQAGGFP
jgi:hypothetical protein